jgi:hypothetical protein
VVAGNEKLILENATKFRPARTMRHEFGDWLAVFGDNEGGAGARDLVHQGKAFRFEFGSFDMARHGDITMVRDPHPRRPQQSSCSFCRDPFRAQPILRHGCREGSLEDVPLDIDWRDDVAGDEKFIF